MNFGDSHHLSIRLTDPVASRQFKGSRLVLVFLASASRVPLGPEEHHALQRGGHHKHLPSGQAHQPEGHGRLQLLHDRPVQDSARVPQGRIRAHQRSSESPKQRVRLVDVTQRLPTKFLDQD